MINNTPPGIQKMFTELACHYDFFNTLASFNLDRSWRKRIASHVEPNSNILDLCTGTGELVFSSAKRINSGRQIVGVDFCKNMLDLALAKTNPDRSNVKINWLMARAEELPITNEYFDYITCAFAFRNVARTIDSVLYEIHRVLKKDGKALILEMGHPSNIIIKKGYHFYLKNIIPLLGFLVYRNKGPFIYLANSIINSYSLDEMAVKFKQAGFREMRYFPLTFGVVGIYIVTK